MNILDSSAPCEGGLPPGADNSQDRPCATGKDDTTDTTPGAKPFAAAWVLEYRDSRREFARAHDLEFSDSRWLDVLPGYLGDQPGELLAALRTPELKPLCHPYRGADPLERAKEWNTKYDSPFTEDEL